MIITKLRRPRNSFLFCTFFTKCEKFQQKNHSYIDKAVHGGGHPIYFKNIHGIMNKMQGL